MPEQERRTTSREKAYSRRVIYAMGRDEWRMVAVGAAIVAAIVAGVVGAHRFAIFALAIAVAQLAGIVASLKLDQLKRSAEQPLPTDTYQPLSASTKDDQ